MPRLTVLIVEDDENDAALLADAFRQAGCAPLPRFLIRAEEAIQYLEGMGAFGDRQKHPLPSIIVLDLKLPGMSGLEFLDWLRGRIEFSTIPVIVLSGSPFVGDVKRAYELGARTFLTKPRGSHELSLVVGTIMRYWSTSGPLVFKPRNETGHG